MVITSYYCSHQHASTNTSLARFVRRILSFRAGVTIETKCIPGQHSDIGKISAATSQDWGGTLGEIVICTIKLWLLETDFWVLTPARLISYR